jgi:hypothetical protein
LGAASSKSPPREWRLHQMANNFHLLIQLNFVRLAGAYTSVLDDNMAFRGRLIAEMTRIKEGKREVNLPAALSTGSQSHRATPRPDSKTDSPLFGIVLPIFTIIFPSRWNPTGFYIGDRLPNDTKMNRDYFVTIYLFPRTNNLSL